MIEAEIIKKNNFMKSQALEHELAQMNSLKKTLIKQNKESQLSFYDLQQQIESQRRNNQQLLQKIEQNNLDIVKNRQIAEKKASETLIQQPVGKNIKNTRKLKENHYISVEKIQLEIENQSKQGIIG